MLAVAVLHQNGGSGKTTLAVMTSRVADPAAADIQRVWRALKGRKHGSQLQEPSKERGEKRAKAAARRNSAPARSAWSRTCLSTSIDA
jgi:hypothetical protein